MQRVNDDCEFPGVWAPYIVVYKVNCKKCCTVHRSVLIVHGYPECSELSQQTNSSQL